MKELEFVLGLLLGFSGALLFFRIKKGSFNRLATEILLKAEETAKLKEQTVDLELKEKVLIQEKRLHQLLIEHQKKVSVDKERLAEREDRMETRLELLDKKLTEIEKKEQKIESLHKLLLEKEQKLVEQEQKIKEEIERLSNWSFKEAREHILHQTKQSLLTENAQLAEKLRAETLENADKEAAKVLSTAIQRVSLSSVSEITTATVFLPNDEMKRRIIGQEGRNIRALEQFTGVNFLLDDTPQAVVLSCFDPIRKCIAKTALQELIQDGRIHPTKIEEVVGRSKNQIEKKIKDWGQQAALKAGVLELHPELIFLLGTLNLRFCSGQNILDHSLEVSFLTGFMAAELGINILLAKRIGLLHDIGKAASQDKEGSHALLGWELALKYGESEEVACGIGSHHEEMAPTTIEASLCSCANTLSNTRPGARSDPIDQYVRRLRKLETLSAQFEGVIQAYALQAGKEIRVIVEPEKVDDAFLPHLAKQLAHRIEQELSYPGKIKITVIRENSVVEYAT